MYKLRVYLVKAILTGLWSINSHALFSLKANTFTCQNDNRCIKKQQKRFLKNALFLGKPQKMYFYSNPTTKWRGEPLMKKNFFLRSKKVPKKRITTKLEEGGGEGRPTKKIFFLLLPLVNNIYQDFNTGDSPFTNFLRWTHDKQQQQHSFSTKCTFVPRWRCTFL